MTDQGFDKGIIILLSTFRNLNADETALKTWRALLGDMDDDTFMQAVVVVCRSHKEFYPGTNVVALIRKHSAIADTTPEEAWAAVMDGINCREHPMLEEAAVKKAVTAMGGWRILRLCQTDELPAHRAHFLRLHAAYQKRAVGDREIAQAGYLVAQLPGTEKKTLPGQGHE